MALLSTTTVSSKDRPEDPLAYLLLKMTSVVSLKGDVLKSDHGSKSKLTENRLRAAITALLSTLALQQNDEGETADSTGVADSSAGASSISALHPLHQRTKSETDRMMREAIRKSPSARVETLSATSRRGVHRRRGSEVMARDNYKIAAVAEVHESFSEELSTLPVKQQYQKAMMLGSDGEEGESARVSCILKLMLENGDDLEYQHFACEALAE